MAEQNKKGTKDSPPGPPPGEGVVQSPSPEEQDQRLRVTRLRDAACPGASRAWQGRRRAAPLSCGQLHAAAVVKAAAEAELGAEVEAAGGRPRRRADRGAAAGGGVETAADRRGRICQNASVCCCAAENCWAKPSTASPNRPPGRSGV